MILPLWVIVTDLRLLSMAYLIALRIKRLLPSTETGLMPIAEDSGKRIFFRMPMSLKNAMTFSASGVPAAHSIPA